MIKKIFLIFIIILLISSPIIIFSIYFVNSFWGPMYELEVNSSNIESIEEVLYKDNIEIENLKNVTKIELCGQGFRDYDRLVFYCSDVKAESVELFHNQNYHIYKYLVDNTFGYNEIFKISLWVSLLTIGATIYVSGKMEI